MLRWIEWDGCPYYYTSEWGKVKTIYYLDKNYKIKDKYEFDKLIQLAVYYDGYYYVEDAMETDLSRQTVRSGRL